MKKSIILFGFILTVSICSGQEWFTNFDVAKRLALVQDKMLLVIWEDEFNYSIPVVFKTEDGDLQVIDIAKDTRLDSFIGNYFVPVKLQESQYEIFVNKAKNRSYSYVNKLNDNSIKIMDFNGNILNVDVHSEEIVNLSNLIYKYALNTSFLRADLENYAEEKNLTTALRLALRYIDYSIFADEGLREELIGLANIYLDESESFILKTKDSDDSYLQKIDLIRLKELVVLNEPKKANRKLKRIDYEEIDAINEPLYVFLNYTISKMLNDESNADLWKSKISSVDLKKAELILKNNMNGIFD